MTGFVLDDTVIHAFAFADNSVVGLISALVSHDTRLSIPAVTLALAQARLSDTQCDEVNGMADNLEHVRLETLSTTWQVTDLSRIVGLLGNDPDMAAAHAIAVARHLDWPILTADRARWADITATMPWPVELVELAEPDERR
ncbi:hypothetical protein [Nocardia sp. NPDC020380]|uniref:hypothetical protein n=1 Tax=Nocardia sp. NPDC020380 TaxID=3364309 RepID=UPI00378CEEA1